MINLEILVSVIIPCYNDGRFIDDAIQSVELNQSHYPVEIIIINDGSTDQPTIDVLKQLEKKYKVINQTNMGLAEARNNGIKTARGKYIIPLDSDNKLNENYLSEAIQFLECNNNCDVVYGNYIVFGEKEKEYKHKPFAFERLIEGNFIDACAVVRKSAYERFGYYDKDMPKMGNEDWELWVRFFLAGAKFHHLNKVGYYYRSHSTSMSWTTTMPGYEMNREYLYKKHALKIILNLIEHQNMCNQKITQFERLKRNKFKGIFKLLLNKY